MYIYGLFMENASWSCQQKCVVEANLGEMSCMMPIIHFQPYYKAPVKDLKKSRQVIDDEQDFYKCPVYKTNERAGVLSTTGKSTNFILTVDLPCVPQDDGIKQLDKHSQSVFSSSLVQQNTRDFWMLRGVAMVTMLNE